MGDSLKFAIQALDEKMTSKMELIEKNLRYQQDGFKLTMEARIGKFVDHSKAEESTLSHFTQMINDEVDSLRKQHDSIQLLLRERVLTLESQLGRFKNQIYILNQAVLLLII